MIQHAQPQPSLERHSYILRLWRPHAQAKWQASLMPINEPAVSATEPHLFASLAQLTDYLIALEEAVALPIDDTQNQ